MKKYNFFERFTFYLMLSESVLCNYKIEYVSMVATYVILA